MWGLPAYLVYCDMGKHPDLAMCTLYGHDVRALDVLFGYWPCTVGHQLFADGRPLYRLVTVVLVIINFVLKVTGYSFNFAYAQ